MQQVNKVANARETIARLEERVESAKGEIEFLIQTDTRMSTDENYRNGVISEKMQIIDKLQEEIQIHQRVLMQHQTHQSSESVSAVPQNVGGRVTRSRAAASDASLSKVAANIQQASRQAISAARPQRAPLSTKPQLTEEEQRRSVEALMEARNWLIMRERQLDTLLDSPAALSYPRDVFQEFHTIQSVRLLMESICERRATGRSDIDTIRLIVKFVASRQ